MLLKSLSTPVLGSLLPSKEIELEMKNDRSPFSCLLSFPTNSQSSVSCKFSHQSLTCDVGRENARFPRIRRAKSENDLHLLDIKCMTSAKVVVDGFWSSDDNKAMHERTGNDGIPSGPQQKSLMLNSSRKHSSISNISGCFGSEIETNRANSTEQAFEYLDSEATSKFDVSGTEHDGSLPFMENSGASMERRPWDTHFFGETRQSRSNSETVWEKKVDCEKTVATSGSHHFCNVPASKTAKCVTVFSDSPTKVSKELGLGIGSGLGNGDGGFGDSFGGRFGNESGSNPEEYYRRMLKANPNHPLLLRNYGRFLFEVVKDYKRAEVLFERAVLATPDDGEVLAQYANLIWHRYRDVDRAALYFEQAVQAAPHDPYVLAANASFVWDSDKYEEQANKPSVGILPTFSQAATASA